MKKEADGMGDLESQEGSPGSGTRWLDSGYIDTKPRIGDSGSGDGVFLVWSFEPWGQLMLPDGHCFSVFASRMVG